MSTLTQASKQWSSRPSDERFTSLHDMLAHFVEIRRTSRAVVANTGSLTVRPKEDIGIELCGKAGVGYEPTHWAFGQLATLAKAPGGYLQSLPPAMAADCLNYGLQFKRENEEVSLLLRKNGTSELRAATGPKYGRVWNEEVVRALVQRFGDGATGEWRVPGEFGQRVNVTNKNTTLYASDRDMFVFLANEDRKIDVAGRQLSRGFFVWNSEVGKTTLGLGTFIFDYVCSNRMIWGASGYSEIKIRHSSGAPDRFFREVAPALETYANSETSTLTTAIEDARKHKLGSELDEFLANRFGPRRVQSLKTVHELEEGRPIETRWDVVVAVTASARSVEYQDERVLLEREAGKLLA